MPATPNSPCLFQVDIFNGTSLIDPSPPLEMIKTLVEYESRRSEIPTQAKGKIKTSIESIAMYVEDFNERLGVNNGLVPSIVEKLRATGHKVIINDHRKFGPRFEIAEQILKEAIGPTVELFKAVRAASQGVIEITDFDQMIEFMGDIIKLYSKARILIPVQNSMTAKAVQYWLRKKSGQRATVARYGVPLPTGRLVISKFRRLHASESREWDIVLIPNAVGVLGDRPIQMMADFTFDINRIYAFLPEGTRLTAREEIRLKAAVGPPILIQIPKLVDVDLLVLPTPPTKDFVTSSTLDFKMKAYWHHDRRNDFVAAVAKSLAKGDLRKIKKHGIAIRDGIPNIRGGLCPKVAVLVESKRHADEIAKRLPDWSIASGATQTKTQAATGPVIATVAAVAQSRLNCDVVVVASGNLGEIQSSRFTPKWHHNNGRSILAVDFRDEFHPWASQATDQRMASANRAGWNLLPPGKISTTGCSK